MHINHYFCEELCIRKRLIYIHCLTRGYWLNHIKLRTIMDIRDHILSGRTGNDQKYYFTCCFCDIVDIAISIVEENDVTYGLINYLHQQRN
jgi:hypothetical protein